MGKSYQQKKAWMRLSSQISPAGLGSVQGWMCLGFPIHSHHEGQMSVVDTQWSPGNTETAGHEAALDISLKSA